VGQTVLIVDEQAGFRSAAGVPPDRRFEVVGEAAEAARQSKLSAA
jgi:hypothetical protein